MAALQIGDAVRVDIAGRVIGKSEFETGQDSFLVEYERAGKKKREWIVADALVADALVVASAEAPE